MSKQVIINEFMSTVAKAVAQLKIDLENPEAPTARGGDVLKIDPPKPVDPIQAGMTFHLDGRDYTVLQVGEDRILCEYFYDAVDGNGFLQTRRVDVGVPRDIVLKHIGVYVGLVFKDGDVEVTVDAVKDDKVYGTDSDGVAYIEDLAVVQVLL